MRTKKAGKLTALLLICLLLTGYTLIAQPARAAGIGVFINGKRLQTEVSPYIQNDRVLVPFRSLFETLGATVNWDPRNRAVTGSKNGKVVRLLIDSSTAYIDNTPIRLDAAASITNGRTFVPLRFVGEALGADVQWDSASNVVRITMGNEVTSVNSGGSVSVSKTISIKDSYGNIVLVPSPPKRIVVCNGNVSEAICALGAADSIVGRSSSTIFPPVLKSRTDVGNWMAPNVEKIISLKPDIFFGYGLYTDKKVVQQLKSHGIPVVMLDCYFLHSMTDDMTTLGKILGKEKEAADFNAFYLKYYKLAVDRTKSIPESKRPLLYVDYYTDYGTVSKGSASQELLDAIGARNVAYSLGVPFPKISSEWVVAKNPQVIFKVVSSSVPNGYGQSQGTLKMKLQSIMQRPGWGNISAVKNKRVFVISSEIFTTVRAPIGILYMAKYLYPDYFQDIDPAAIHREWLSRFYGLPANGAWVYPEPQ